MRNALLAFSAVAVLAGMAPASAADLYEPGVVAAAAPAGFDGFYAGVSLGAVGVGGEISADDYSDTDGFHPAESSAGFLLGGQIGYNFALSDAFVFGIEASASAVFSEDTICSIDEGCGDYNGDDAPAVSFNLNALGALNAKVGFTAAENIMIYGLVGPALASVTTHHWDSDEYDGKNRLFAGWDVGIGAEMMVSDNMSLGLEARYYDFSNDDLWEDASSEEFGASPTVWTLAAKANVRF